MIAEISKIKKRKKEKNLYPSSTLSYTIIKKPKRVNFWRKSHWGSWSSWGSSLTALSLVGFTVIRTLFTFPIYRILFCVLSDRVFFESSEIGSFTSGFSVTDYSFHQCYFSAMPLLFYQIVLLLFYQKQNFVPDDNCKMNNKNDNPNKLIIAKKSKWLIKSTRFI